ncbi:DUF5790 family protein [Halanaeroarchaeum sulfurireducens]|uniref:Uncharacterized protein n=1 Tax=Halanaeroarchaeum sulfurireducens TaxID=1604004 RepID=A0A0F7PBG8_9EURY|nr:DUF5790 family protein [Halanaeroarchaeum sulfurireducens]AKH96989.1 hypothetical protein HLASF_0489 [Halanaeroarchaeum sulfurireducens]ALG81390.1 hypothetical protein HLASA_0486 [Halanaeroarchaeum sulfurireducens]
MSQTTLDDDDLFGEAAEEIRADVERHLDAATAELPEPSTIWEVESANTLGVLNALRSSLEVEAARDHLRDAKKWYTMGERADAFDDAADLADRIESVESIVRRVEETSETVGELTASIPDLKGSLEDAHEES